MSADAEQAASHWFDAPQVAPLGAGHIHDTYEVRADSGHFVLQRVNHEVFKQPELLMAQTERLLQQWRQQQRYVVPRLVPNRVGAVGKWIDGQYWRVWEYVSNTVVIDPLQNTAQAHAAGAAFGAFQRCLAQLPGAPLQAPIPGFLQLSHYLQAYDVAVDTAKDAKKDAKKDVKKDAPANLRRLIDHHRSLALLLGERNAVIHGDCKINNLLFDSVHSSSAPQSSGSQVVAIIDFDTAMTGHWAWDFGDLIRSICSSHGAVDVDYFAAALRGFAAEQPACTAQACVAAPGYVTLMLAVRFLTDHLQGDHYFRVEHRGENLQRAEQQFALFESFLGVEPHMREAAADILA